MAHIFKIINAEGGSSGGGSATPFTQTFNASTDWGSASGGDYSITIPQSTHDKSVDPLVQVFELSLGIFELVETEVVVNSFGDVTISVTEIFDNRFAGKVVIF